MSDLTNSPLRVGTITPGAEGAWLDGIVCDPPYGIREGLKVLGPKTEMDDEQRATHLRQCKEEGYIPPKRPYSFTALLDDILAFAAATLVPGGRLAMWMPTANDEDIDLLIPSHPCLQREEVCVQAFNKWSRRLLVYRRRLPSEINKEELEELEKRKREYETGTRASDLNDFRRKYFEGFREFEDMKKEFIRMKVQAGIREGEAREEAELLEQTRESAAEKAGEVRAVLVGAAREEDVQGGKADELGRRLGREAKW